MLENKISRQVREGLIERSRNMRANPTPAEALLWKKLRKRQLNRLKFRRQHIIQVYIVDFCCLTKRLVIEIDGPIHLNQKDYDQEREVVIRSMGYQVIRFSNEEVIGNIEEDISKILSFLWGR
ncbi:MAG: endonuclease domain-containing protein [Anaerolineaceae bacterium]|nr:endonuclease domain-containing protein [Anaerolineaceae bacterium]